LRLDDRCGGANTSLSESFGYDSLNRLTSERKSRAEFARAFWLAGGQGFEP
jgi:hypothetical protein